MGVVDWLVYCTVTDRNYKLYLERAADEEIRKAIDFMNGKKGHKGRFQACERELRRRAKRKAKQASRRKNRR